MLLQTVHYTITVLPFFFQKTDGTFVTCLLVMIEKMKPTPDDKEFLCGYSHRFKETS